AKSTADNSLYRAGKRGWLWIKWKKEYAHEMQDTFDLVVIGSFRGKGRRKSVFGALLCALYNKDNSRFESFTKVGSGYTDKDFRDIMDELETHKTDKQLNDVVVEKEMQPDEYYEPKIVIEVVGAEITESPLHTAGKSRLNKEKGLALRFPRFIRIRPDKKPKQATSVNEVIKMRT
ncbi:MAG: DNA ligase, partial [Candidatus Woesearchaeota archaeon]